MNFRTYKEKKIFSSTRQLTNQLGFYCHKGVKDSY